MPRRTTTRRRRRPKGHERDQFDLEVCYRGRKSAGLEDEVEKTLKRLAITSYKDGGRNCLVFGFRRKDSAERAWDLLDYYEWSRKLFIKLYRVEPDPVVEEWLTQ